MATPKEQHDARRNARNVGHPHHRTPPADATPPGGVPRMTREQLLADDVEGASGGASAPGRLGGEVPPEQGAERP
ncbi:hypothetical protein [Roseisolibacter sp. H3M3-2]|uniref:hypothetical protein n=1 Tax=Roseisolibacter sp. H3M3-2 TaxID=3031323 RepID=UPI0023D985FD|nr:hypothetical protein [Roseisolibacter sp. H3M3-2]MDF1504907.1 hypothetical protein [Roseisolibacter sp. H3M3-2]